MTNYHERFPDVPPQVVDHLIGILERDKERLLKQEGRTDFTTAFKQIQTRYSCLTLIANEHGDVLPAALEQALQQAEADLSLMFDLKRAGETSVPFDLAERLHKSTPVLQPACVCSRELCQRQLDELRQQCEEQSLAVESARADAMTGDKVAIILWRRERRKLEHLKQQAHDLQEQLKAEL